MERLHPPVKEEEKEVEEEQQWEEEEEETAQKRAFRSYDFESRTKMPRRSASKPYFSSVYTNWISKLYIHPKFNIYKFYYSSTCSPMAC